MDKYIGLKGIQAAPMTAKDAGKLLGRPIDTSNADAEGNGYLVQYPDGYLSWSPKAQFEKAYFKTEGLTFNQICDVVIEKLAEVYAADPEVNATLID
jgi:hypothetical protein